MTVSIEIVIEISYSYTIFHVSILFHQINVLLFIMSISIYITPHCIHIFLFGLYTIF